MVTVPRFGPERICWALSGPTMKSRAAMSGLPERGLRHDWSRRRALPGDPLSAQSPQPLLVAPVPGGTQERAMLPVRWYKAFLEWDIVRHPRPVALLDRLLNPLIGKSIAFYLKRTMLMELPLSTAPSATALDPDSGPVHPSAAEALGRDPLVGRGQDRPVGPCGEHHGAHRGRIP